MELLPPVGWADVATKADLESLYNRIEALVYRELLREVGGLHAEIGGIRDEIQRQTRTILVSMVGILASAAGPGPRHRATVGLAPTNCLGVALLFRHDPNTRSLRL
jgi:hypothetical protein